MRPSELALWLGLPPMLLGQLAWLIASEKAKSWLAENDPAYAKGALASLFAGRLFAAFRPMARYRALRRARGESTTLVTVFWAGLLTSLAGVGLFFLLLFGVSAY